jgi:hypothetical protein
VVASGLSRTSELDVNRWSALQDATVTVWPQDLVTGANTWLARLFLPAWAVWVSVAGTLDWLTRRCRSGPDVQEREVD